MKRKDTTETHRLLSKVMTVREVSAYLQVHPKIDPPGEGDDGQIRRLAACNNRLDYPW
jgi:hypothetical protein